MSRGGKPRDSSAHQERGGRGGRGGSKGLGGRSSNFVSLDGFEVINRHSLVDIGLNLTHKQFASDRARVVERAMDHAVTRMILTGTSERHSQLALREAKSHKGVMFSTVGVHPHDANSVVEGTVDKLRQMITSNRDVVVAVGECGLDFDRNFSPPAKQVEVFRQQIRLADELKLPLFCHERKAFKEFVEVLESEPHGPVVVHCFTGNEEELLKYLELGFYIGITGWLCDERRGVDLQRIVHHIPMDKIMIETDAPFLTYSIHDPSILCPSKSQPPQSS